MIQVTRRGGEIMEKNISNQLQELRQQAQARLNNRVSQAQEDLELYQTELTIQHEELRRSHNELNNLYEEYWYLYHFAPCGYITLNHNGIITKFNQKALEMLGSKNAPLNYLGFSRFIVKEYQNSFFETLQTAEKSLETQHLDLRLISSNDESVWVRLDIRPHFTQGGQVSQWHITLIELD
ncbi:PAS/PAC sensor hybrid histidine kinase [Halothece sp. PCC 7418]|uniref:PAS domain-containing protein n=1 Tax=Halothece sp. (strain PCC 7418) TaxID=65093 RepID=UPI0002A074CF|nr:PAS domain-containing protein [Halothece sp. PCC 7418]AFZ44565.1 PAS/PAC sensor hybrid histidine kinase [Halothece sp. PCC 7418]